MELDSRIEGIDKIMLEFQNALKQFQEKTKEVPAKPKPTTTTTINTTPIMAKTETKATQQPTIQQTLFVGSIIKILENCFYSHKLILKSKNS